MNLVNPYRFFVFTDPTDIAGLDLWLDASDSSTLFDATSGGSTPSDDGDVRRWEDKSGNNYHCTQATPDFCPHRRVAEVNSLDAIDFEGDGVTDTVSHWLTGSDVFTQTSAKSVFIVTQADTTTIGDGGNLFNLYDNGVTGAEGNISTEVGYRVSGRTWLGDGACSTTVASLVTLTQSGSGDLHTVISMWVDGTAVSESGGTDGAVVDNAGIYLVGTSNNNASTTSLNGRLCEIIVYNSELSGGNREAVETYLADKWGITI